MAVLRMKSDKRPELSTLIGTLLAAVPAAHAEHLMTRSYAMHKTLDELYSDLPEVIDELAEAYLGEVDVKIIPKLPFDYVDPKDLVTRLLMECRLVHPTLPPELSNPLEDVMTFLSQILYKLKLS